MKKLLKFLSYVLVAAVASAATLFWTQPSGTVYSKLDRLEALIQQRFIGEWNETAMEDAAASAMVKSLGDRWSYYIPAEEYESYLEQMNNAYVGIGVTTEDPKDGQGVIVVKVTPGGPAEEAGIRAGDRLWAVEGQEVSSIGTAAAKELIRGRAGTSVAVTILRDGAQVAMQVTRRSIQSPVAWGTLLAEDVGLVRIENFDSRCAEETIAAIRGLLEQGAKRLVFDVRNNPGGYKTELVEVLDCLLPEGVLFRSEDYTGKVEEDRSDKNCLDLPMAVLVNENSYSAAEFFAAALSEYGVAEVVGQQTCGKGYFQNTFRLGDGSAVGLSVGKYFTPNGVSLAGVGITPDRVVEVDGETARAIYLGLLAAEEDPQVQAAVAALAGK